MPGKALSIATAKITVGEFTATAGPDEGNRSITFTVDLKKGPTELQTWLRDADGQEICGAYYVTVTRLP